MKAGRIGPVDLSDEPKQLVELGDPQRLLGGWQRARIRHMRGVEKRLNNSHAFTLNPDPGQGCTCGSGNLVTVPHSRPCGTALVVTENR